MYIGFLNDRKELKLLIEEEEEILDVKTEKGHKRKFLIIGNWFSFWDTQRLC